VLLFTLIVLSGHCPHSYPLQDTRRSQEEQEKDGAEGNGVVKGGSVASEGVGIGELVRESVGKTGVGVVLGI
jgi:hypothetical protein